MKQCKGSRPRSERSDRDDASARKLAGLVVEQLDLLQGLATIRAAGHGD